MTDSIAPDVAVQEDLRRLAEAYPALAALVGLYRAIEALQAQIAGAAPPLAQLPASDQDAGQPLLCFDALPLTPGPLAAWVAEMRVVLLTWGVAAAQADDEWGDASPARLLALLRAGFEAQAGPTEGPFASGLTGLAAGQVLAGLLKGYSAGLRSAFQPERWFRGYCPICGGRPDLGLISPQNETRTLACARCDAVWPYRRVGCPFCGQDERMRRYVSPDGRFSLAVCGSCGEYLKQARWPAAKLPQSLIGLRLLTVGMDLEAQQAAASADASAQDGACPADGAT